MKKKLVVLLVVISMLLTACSLGSGDNPTQETADTFDDYISMQDIETPTSLQSGSEIVLLSEMRQFVYEWLNSYDYSRLSSDGFTEEYKNQFGEAALALENAEVLSLQGEIDTLSLKNALILGMNIKLYFEGEVSGNYSDLVTGADLLEYYQMLYPYFETYAVNAEELIAPDRLLEYLEIDPDSVINRANFAKFFITLREAATGFSVDLSQNDPMYVNVILDANDDYMKMMHKLGVYLSGRTSYIHPERELNLYEFKSLMNNLLIYSDCFHEEGYRSHYVTADELMELFETVYLYTKDMEATEKDIVVVDNRRDYSVYVSQYDGSEYSHINCVPTSAAMLANWYNSENSYTGEMVRNDNDITNGHEWSISVAQQWLDKTEIPYELVYNDIDALKVALDEGAAVQVMVDTGITSHSIVVIGYKQVGEDVYFMVLDPGEDPSYLGFDHQFVFYYESILQYMIIDKSDNFIIVK